MTDFFVKQIKQLAKKYPHVYRDIDDFFVTFDPNQHTSLGQGLYKCRIKNSSANTGKRGGFRLIVYVTSFNLPVIIYSKTDRTTISHEDIVTALEHILDELNHT